ncbi:hypothetical protein H0H92_000097 [Tricholoma furcatifolium]|nr:hypothetical protein H0H92_000097 [Tricholoma furcatifolium]
MSNSSRISLAGYLGTVKYTGPVEGTSGTWLGVEWDDPSRGKHNGVKDGKQYFTCHVHNSGSFIRPSPKISYGQSFLDALTAKYIENPHGSATPEQVVLGSSQGAIVVEAVNLDKIRGKLADLSRLREVSLDGLDVATCDTAGVISRTCPSYEMLSHTRLVSGTDSTAMGSAFLQLTELQLNGTMLPWSEMQKATAFMPRLESIEFGYNGLTQLYSGDDLPPRNKTIRDINLDGNEFWSDIDALAAWCPNLESLTLGGNPLATQEQVRNLRPFIISKIPTLTTLDGAEDPGPEEDKLRLHPQWLSLCQSNALHPPLFLKSLTGIEHGRPDDTAKVTPAQNKLSQRLIVLNLYRSLSPTASDYQQVLKSQDQLILRVLPTMTLRALRMKTSKTLKLKSHVLFWVQQIDGILTELGTECDDQKINWLGLDEGTPVVFHITET